MSVIEMFQNLVAQVPELVQPLIVALAAAVPFIEGEGAVAIGIFGGISPVIAAIAAMAGNFLCVAVLVYAGSGARSAIVNRRRTRALVTSTGDIVEEESDVVVEESARAASRRRKFMASFERYGVPGVSLLGPLLLPTMFTATMLAAIGIAKGRILFWQAVAIVGWTTVLALLTNALVSTAI